MPRKFGQSSIVCVCNSSYCDTIEPNIPVPRGTYAVYTSAKIGQRFDRFEGKFTQTPSSKGNLNIRG